MTEADKNLALDREKLTYLLNATLTNQAMLAALLDSQAHLLTAVLETSHEVAKQGLTDLVERSRQIVLEAAEAHLRVAREAMS